MKELSIEQKAKAYDEAKLRMSVAYNSNRCTIGFMNEIFPELKESEESEDERIRKELIKFVKVNIPDEERYIAWLEKQGSEPNWCHHNVDLSNCSEEYRKAYYDGWNNCNMQHSQCESEKSDVLKCLINGMKFYYEDNKEATWGTEKFSMKVKDILSWLEKQGEHANFLSKIQVGDKVTRNEGGVLVNLSQLNRVAKKQGEQKETLCDKCRKEQPSHSCQDITALGRCAVEHEHKVELKFRKGDWIVHHGTENIYQVVAVIDNQYQLKYGDTYTIQKCADVDRCSRLYDVAKDAKSGDVLSDGTTIFIFKDLLSDGSVMSYCDYDTDSGESDTFCPLSVNLMCSKITPATKQQRELLFKKMYEAGYEWDAEKKELKKIEQKPAWSEEDEKMLSNINDCIINLPVFYESININGENKITEQFICAAINWLKSLKDRVQPKQEWGEEDDRMREAIIDNIQAICKEGYFVGNIGSDKLIDWLKSLRPQTRWKPSEEQMSALKQCMDYRVNLRTLYEDLKKLRGK